VQPSYTDFAEAAIREIPDASPAGGDWADRNICDTVVRNAG
jgi:hypothetical protein